MPKRNRQSEIKRNINRNGGTTARPKQNKNRGRGRQGNGFTDPLTPKQARRMAGAGARAEYAPVIRGAKANIRASRNREREVGGWFNQLGGQIEQAQGATDASYGQANAAMTANIQAAQAAAAKNQQNVAAQDAQFAALTGADPGSFSDTAQTMNAGAEQRAIAQSALAAPIAAAGAAQSAYLGNTEINARREGIQQRLIEGKRRRKIKEDLFAARKERSQKAQADFRDIRNEERDYGIQRAAFKLDKMGMRADAASDAADRRQRQRENEEDNDTSRSNNQEDNAPEKGGKGGRTQSQVRSDRREQKNANIMARNLYQAAEKKPGEQGAPNWPAFTQLLIQEGVEPWAAKRAVAKLRRKQRKRSQYDPHGVGREGL